MTPPLRTEPSPRERLSRALSLSLAATLLLMCAAWELLLTGSWFWALKALPLAAALGGLSRYRLYTYRWVALLVWLYACEGLVHLGASHGALLWLGTVEALLAVALFMVVTWHIRLRLSAASAETTVVRA